MPVDNRKVTFVVIACLACAAHGVQAGPKTFDVAAAYEAFQVPGSAMGIAVAFLDNDGVQDLAVATSYVSGVTILFGNCSGSFGDRMDLPVGTFASAVAAGDFDGDGIADLVVGGDALYVIRGLGHRMFAPAVQVSSNGTLKLRLADVTGDGRLDVVIAGSTSSIAILRGRGDGTFAAPTFVGLGASAFDVAVGDLNGDGIQDMATANADAGTISVILSHGDGTFAPSTSLSVGGYPYSIALSDLDGDGTADIVAGRAGAQVISVYRSRGDGTFFAGVDYASPGDYSICTADLNDDGSPDIVQSDGSMSVTSFLNRGDGMFSSGRLFAANSSPVAVAAGLLDGDNHVDLAVVNANANMVSALHGNGDGTFGGVQSFTTGSSASSLISCNLNHDAANDAITCNYSSFSVLFGDGLGGLSMPIYYQPVNWPGAVAIGDFNEDDELDIAVVGGGYRHVSIFPGVGGGRLGPSTNVPTRQAASSVACGDVDGDGHLDLVTTGTDSNSVCIAYGHGDGTFSSSYLVPPGAYGYPLPALVGLADIDRDGHIDILVARSLTNTLSVIPGRGGGTFDAPADYLIGADPSRLAVGDLNGDGWPDIGIANGGSSSVSILVGNGDGTLALARNYFVGSSPSGIAFGDLDGDGIADVSASAKQGTVAVILGAGDGTFTTERFFGSGRGLGDVALSDQNDDGKLDILTCESGSVNVILNRTVRDQLATPSETRPVGRGLSVQAVLNPSSERLVVRLTLPTNGPVCIEVLDIAGRRVSKDVRGLARGSHELSLAGAGAIPPGIYLVRVVQAGLSAATKVALVH